MRWWKHTAISNARRKSSGSIRQRLIDGWAFWVCGLTLDLCVMITVLTLFAFWSLRSLVESFLRRSPFTPPHLH